MTSINLETKHKPPPVHQPPPPRRHSGGSQMDGLTDSQMNTGPTTKRNEDDEEEENSVIDVPKKLLNVKTNINSLPDDIMFDIIIQLPAQDIYRAVRPVCLKWYQMIHTHKFVNAHLHRSPYGLLFKNRAPQTTAQLTFMTLSRQGRIELTRLKYEPGDNVWWHNSCNGLILMSECSSPRALYITNPATMQHFVLPPFLCISTDFGPSALAYASLSMEYKVVRVYYQKNQWYCAILTAGVDESWRHVRTQHLSREAKGLFGLRPLTTEGFVYWAAVGNYVLTLNVETEIITEYVVPSVCSGGGLVYIYYYFPTAKYLSLFRQRLLEMPRRGWSWEVWEMKPETGEWTKLPGIELNDRKCEILEWCDGKFRSDGYSERGLGLIGWLEYKEVLVFCVNSSPFEEHRICVAWNVRSKKIEFIELDPDQDFFTVHRNCLLWLDGCS